MTGFVGQQRGLTFERKSQSFSGGEQLGESIEVGTGSTAQTAEGIGEARTRIDRVQNITEQRLQIDVGMIDGEAERLLGGETGPQTSHHEIDEVGHRMVETRAAR